MSSYCGACRKRTNLKTFRMPVNEQKRKLWADSLDIEYTNQRICENHFKKTDFYYADSMNSKRRLRLRAEAIPEQCLLLFKDKKLGSPSENAEHRENQINDETEAAPSYDNYQTENPSAASCESPPIDEDDSLDSMFLEDDDPLAGEDNKETVNQLMKCRACYRDYQFDSSAKDVFVKQNAVLLYRIEVICGVWLTSIEGGPRYMCPDCQSALNTAIEFREKVISTEVKLTQGNPVCDIAAVEVELDSAENYQGTSTIEWPLGLICKEEDEEAKAQNTILSPNIEMLEPLEEDIGADPSDPLSVARGTDILKELVIELIGTDKVTPERPARKTKVDGEEEDEETIEDAIENYMDDVIEEESSEQAKKQDKKKAKKAKAREAQPKRKVNAKLKRERERIRLAKMREKPPNYVCDQCGSAFHLVHNLQIHMLRHSRTKNFQCTECPMKFYDAYMRNIHIRVRHKGELPFACRHCPEAFTNAGARHTHECKLHGVKVPQSNSKAVPKERQQPQRFFCETCDKSYVSKYALAWHVKSHAEANAFKCKLCDKSYNAPAMLKQHERVHKERPLQCDVCLKGFYQRTKLKAHKLIHSGERPHRCELCNVHFRYKTNLKTHENTKMHQENLRKVHESVTVDIE
ncbi:zinc finger and BTB domain-containing protein 24-like [Drosophila obscura]|uniref:zinc finger and BTB domain-containing protein 24-like n=1 Tax=Drosophila obscura TaxID=7282 RepID=UPI000BA00C78|nr:zinc finger and BTB domain-containing protein 24-like [Drosophila obscura]